MRSVMYPWFLTGVEPGFAVLDWSLVQDLRWNFKFIRRGGRQRERRGVTSAVVRQMTDRVDVTGVGWRTLRPDLDSLDGPPWMIPRAS